MYIYACIVARYTNLKERALHVRKLSTRILRSYQFKNNYFTEMCSGSEAGTYLVPIDFCITQPKACE